MERLAGQFRLRFFEALRSPVKRSSRALLVSPRLEADVFAALQGAALVESLKFTVSALAHWFRAPTENDRGTRRTMIVPPLLGRSHRSRSGLDFDVAKHLEIRDLPSVAVLDEDHTLEQVKAMSRELLSPPGSSLRCDLRSKNSA